MTSAADHFPLSASSEGPTRHFIGWDRPLAAAVTDWLAADWKGGTLDLSDRAVIVPTAEAGRSIRERLARRAASAGAGMLSPQVLTPDVLVQHCVASEIALASPVEALAAWVETLMGIDLGHFATLFPVHPPEQDFGWAVGIARQLDRARAALAEAGLSFGLAGTTDDIPETERWQQLARIESLYLSGLRRRRLWDPEAAKIDSRQNPRWPWPGIRRVILAHVADPLPLAVDFLDALRKSDGLTVDVLVWAPPGEAVHFDAWGRPLTEDWAERAIALPDPADRIHVEADPEAQAALVASWLPSHPQPAATLALGVADPAVARPLERAFASRSVATFHPEGQKAAQHPLSRVLDASLQLLSAGDWPALVRFWRLPPLRGPLRDEKLFLLRAADEFQASHLPVSLDDVLERADRSSPTEKTVASATEAVRTQLRAFSRRPFPEALATWLSWIHRGASFDLAQPADARFAELADRLAALAAEIEAAFPPTTPARDKLALLAQLFGSETLPETHLPEAVDLNGWLELPWQDAPHLVVTGFNDAFVPAAPTPDPFLPDSLREKLGLRCHRTRVACDTFSLTAMVESRRQAGRVDLICGQTGGGEEALRPSRLLFRCPDEELASRVRQLFAEPQPRTDETPTRAWKLQPRATESQARLERLPVTGFSLYLACPFRFFLRHVLKMKQVDPTRQELDAQAFGTLCHAAFEFFAKDENARRSTDERIIRQSLMEGLDRQVAALFGKRWPLSLHLQIEVARQRLTSAVPHQAAARADGWLITHVEQTLETLRGAPFAIDGIQIRGQVDRLEKNECTGAWRVVDYKTSQKPSKPKEAHTTKDQRLTDEQPWRRLPSRDIAWTNLQVPLYGAALREKFGPQFEGAYFNLPKAVGEAGLAPWPGIDSATLDSAVVCATGVIQAIRSRRFWPPNEAVKWDDFEDLWLDSISATCEPPVIEPDPLTAPMVQMELGL